MVTSARGSGGARSLALRTLTRAEQRELTAKLKDLSLAARVHQRYRLIEELRGGRPIADAADRVGCSHALACDWVRKFNDSGFRRFESASARRVEPLMPPATE
jgi:hypothetical protein